MVRLAVTETRTYSMCTRLPRFTTCCVPPCACTCTTRLYDYTLATPPDDAYGEVDLVAQLQPSEVVLPSDQVAAVWPCGACSDLGFFGSLRLEVVGEVESRPSLEASVQILVDGEPLLDVPTSKVLVTLVPGAWTGVGVRAVGKDVVHLGRDLLFAAGAHTYSVLVTVSTNPYVAVEGAELVLQFKGAFTMTTSR
jgi:hypothetical protein